MDSSNALFGGVIFILLVVGANLVMYAVVRGAARGGRRSFLETFAQSLNASAKKKGDSMEELRRKIEELKQGKKDAGKDSE